MDYRYRLCDLSHLWNGERSLLDHCHVYRDQHIDAINKHTDLFLGGEKSPIKCDFKDLNT